MKIHPNSVVGDIEYDTKIPPKTVTTPNLELQRTYLDEVKLDNLHTLFHELDHPEEVFRYCGWNYHNNIADTRKFLKKRTIQWNEREKYSYIIVDKASGDFIGNTYIEPRSDGKSCKLGIWLRKSYWGENIHSQVTDIRVHLSFELLNFIYIKIGCLDGNINSLKAIVRAIKRYNGNYYGAPPAVKNNYINSSEKKIVPHHEFYVGSDDYQSEKTGIKSTIPGVKWHDTEAYNRIS